MVMEPIVSIIMPVHNLERYVGVSIDSVIGQSFKEWELIIVNDGSVDATEKIIQLYMDREARIRYYLQEPAGVSTARNRGLNLARGEYISFLDGDDLWDSLFLEKCIAVRCRTGADFIFCNYNRLMPNGNLKKGKMDIDTDLADVGSIILQVIRWKAHLLMGNFLFPKNILNGRIDFEAGCCFGEDTEFICKVLTMGKKAYYIPEELFTYRYRLESATQYSWDWQKRCDAVYAMDRAFAFICENYMGSLKNEVEEVFRSWLSYTRYRLMLGMLKKGDFEPIHSLLARSGWREALQTVMKNYNYQRKIKAKIIHGENEFFWRLLALPYVLSRFIR